MAMKNVGMERGSQNRNSDFHALYRLARPVEKNMRKWGSFWRKVISRFRIIVTDEGACCKVVRK
jgi:hypothetical protein